MRRIIRTIPITRWGWLALLLLAFGLPLSAGERPMPRCDRLGDPLPAEALARMDSGRLRQGGHVSTLSFSADGKLLISAGRSKVRVWDAETGKLRMRFDVETDWTLTCALTADGLAVANAGPETCIVTVRLLDPASGKVRRRTEMKERTTTANLTFSPDGKRIAFSNSQGNKVWVCDAATGQAVLSLPTEGRFAREIAYAADGNTIALADVSDTIRIYDAASGKIVRRLKHEGDTVTYARFSPDGRFLASIPGWNTDPGEISIWDVKGEKERYRWKSPDGHVLRAAFSPDSRYVAIGCQYHDLILRDLATGAEVRRYPTDAYFAQIAFSPDGKKLAAASGEGAIRLWETATGRVLPGSADPSIDAVRYLRFHEGGRRLIGYAALPIAWEPATGREVRRFFKSADHHRFALSPDESLLADADLKGTIHLRDSTTGKELRALEGHESKVWGLIFSPDGRQLASSSTDGTIRVWELANGRERHKLLIRNDYTSGLTFSADGRWLASASASPGKQGAYEVLLWDLSHGREKTRFTLAQDNDASEIAFAPDGRLLAAVGGGRFPRQPGEVKVWETATGRLRYALEGHPVRASSVTFSPDGRMLATGDAEGHLLVWELATGKKRHSFVGHESWIKSIAFSADARLMAAASYEAPVYVWDVFGSETISRGPLSEEQLGQSWSALANADAAVAFAAIRRLAAAPEQTLPYLREHLKPVPAPDVERVRHLVRKLDSDDFSERRKAMAELKKIADAAAGTLRQMANEKASLYVRRSLQQILDDQEKGPASLRAVRTVEALEWIGTPEAVRLLDELAKGVADARLTRAAAAARQRLHRSKAR